MAAALKSRHLGGYAGDVWFPQPAPADHPWRTMPFNAMTPHISGTSLSGQARYAAGTREILVSIDRPECVMTQGLAGASHVLMVISESQGPPSCRVIIPLASS